MDNDAEKLLKIWDTDLRIICHAHYDAAVALGRRNLQLGIPVIVLSAIVGTSIFASLQNNADLWAKIVAGLTSLLVTILAVLQTFLRFSERAEHHREAGARYGALLKELEQHAAFPPSNSEFASWCTDFRNRWDELSLKAPSVPKTSWEKNFNRHTKKKQQIVEPGNT